MFEIKYGINANIGLIKKTFEPINQNEVKINPSPTDTEIRIEGELEFNLKHFSDVNPTGNERINKDKKPSSKIIIFGNRNIIAMKIFARIKYSKKNFE